MENSVHRFMSTKNNNIPVNIPVATAEKSALELLIEKRENRAKLLAAMEAEDKEIAALKLSHFPELEAEKAKLEARLKEINGILSNGRGRPAGSKNKAKDSTPEQSAEKENTLAILKGDVAPTAPNIETMPTPAPEMDKLAMAS